MKKTKDYQHTRFSADALREAIGIFRTETSLGESAAPRVYMSVEVDDADWKHDSAEEFFADYRRSTRGALYEEDRDDGQASFRVQAFGDSTLVTIGAQERHKIETVFEVFERHLPSSRLPLPPSLPAEPPIIFIGHGANAQWRDLKDHLHEKHGCRVEAYEIGARAGHAIRDILGAMLSSTSFAILVMTGEDRTAEGGLRARQNVVHEAGLFQGRLGFDRAIVLLEEGVEEFSNIHGIEQIRFPQGRIKETFGEVLATLRREFPEGAA